MNENFRKHSKAATDARIVLTIVLRGTLDNYRHSSRASEWKIPLFIYYFNLVKLLFHLVYLLPISFLVPVRAGGLCTVEEDLLPVCLPRSLRHTTITVLSSASHWVSVYQLVILRTFQAIHSAMTTMRCFCPSMMSQIFPSSSRASNFVWVKILESGPVIVRSQHLY